MKKLLIGIFAAVSIISAGVLIFSASFRTEGAASAFTVIAGGEELDFSDLPFAPYKEGDVIMVPLFKIAEALGYQTSKDLETGAIIVDDDYIQKAILHEGTASVLFEGHLKIINMSREIENAAKTVVHDECVYVSLEFFQEFFNDITIEGSTITISPSMCELDNTQAIY